MRISFRFRRCCALEVTGLKSIMPAHHGRRKSPTQNSGSRDVVIRALGADGIAIILDQEHRKID